MYILYKVHLQYHFLQDLHTSNQELMNEHEVELFFLSRFHIYQKCFKIKKK